MTQGRVAPEEIQEKACSYLNLMDFKYRRLLKGVSLVAELGIDHEEAKKLVRYTAVATSSMGIARKREFIIDYWPATWVVGVAGLAVQGYQQGGFWPALHEALDGYYQSDIILPPIKDAYLRSLERLELPVTRDPGHQLYMSNVVLHSGIPNYCLADWFRMLSMAAHQVGDDVESVIPWCRQRIDSASLYFVDRPIRLMLEHGDEFAFDLADRSLAAISLALDGDAVDLDNPSYFTSVALPKRFTDSLVRWMRRDRVKATNSGRRRKRRMVPQTELDLTTGDVIVTLPPVPDADDSFWWSVRLDDQTPFRVHPDILWDGGMAGVDASGARVNVPARMIHVQGSTVDGNSLRLVDPDRPVLAFDTSGRRLSPFTPLPSGRVWLVLPATVRASATCGGEPLPLVAEADPPLGWAHWETVCVDLEGSPSLEFHENPRFVWHISSQRTASIECSDPVGEVKIEGYAVHAERPSVTLPAEGVQTQWRIDVYDAVGGRLVLSDNLIIAQDTRVDPWSASDQPVRGLYTLVVRGPLGRGTKRTIAVLEGLEYRVHPSIRMIRLKGLQTAEVELVDTWSGGTVHVEFDGRTAHKAAQFGGLSVQVQPAALAVADDGPDKLPSWTHQPVRIPVEDLHERALMVRSLDGTELRPWVTCQGVPRQQLTPTSRRGNVQTYSLQTIVDTVEIYGQAHIELREPNDPDASSVPLAFVAPRALTTGVALEGGEQPQIRLMDYRPADVECFVWATAAPWLEPHRSEPTREGIVSLPPGWDHLGDLYVRCRLVDEWDPEPPPRWPTHRDFRAHAAAAGLPDDLRSRFMLRGEGQPPDLPPSEAWKVLRFLEMTKHAVPLAVDRWLTDSLHVDSVESLRVLGDLTADPATSVGLLARADLSATPVVGPSLDEADAVKLVNQNGLIGALLACRDATGTLAPDLRIALDEALGEPIGEILSGEADPAATGGAFSRNTNALAHMPPEQFEDMVTLMSLVPRALLDMDSRAQAALTLFSEESGCRRLSRDAHSLTSTVKRLLHEAYLERAEAALDSRRHPDDPKGWPALSAASLSYALASRYAAYGHEEFARVLTYFEQWRYLPEGIRPLHAIDLVLAEAYAAFDHAMPEGTDVG